MYTREQWLNDFAHAARPAFKDAGAPLPSNVRISIGFPSRGIRSKSIGECWASTCTVDGVFEIFINPTLKNASRIADVLTHELVHAAVGLEAKHGRVFKKVAVALGLEGKMTATVAGQKWHDWAGPLLEKLGQFPGAPLSSALASSAKPKQSTRMLKCECGACGFTFRTSAKWLQPTLICPDPSCGAAINVGGGEGDGE